MRSISILLILLLAACANVKPVTTVGPITGSANFEIGQTSFPPPVVTTVVRKCVPPDQLLSQTADLHPIKARKMTMRGLVKLSLSDARAYNILAKTHTQLAQWVKQNCQ